MPQFFVNQTIDDEFGDSLTGARPTYIPASFWSLNSSCDGCVVHPDSNLAFNHTWHDSSQFPGTEPVSVALNFVGTAIHVFCILPPITPNVVTLYNLNFTLDGASRGSFSQAPTSTTEFVYNLPVLSLDSLPNKAHTLLISTDDSVDGSIFLFDYAVYTTVQGTADSKNNTGVAAGSAFGAIVLVGLIVTLLVLRRRRQKRPSILPIIEPFDPSPGAPPTATSPSMANAQTPAALIRQLQHALDTVLRQRDRPTSATASSPVTVATHHATSSLDYSTPPPVYEAGRSSSPPPPQDRKV